MQQTFEFFPETAMQLSVLAETDRTVTRALLIWFLTNILWICIHCRFWVFFISGCQILVWIELLFPEKELYVQGECKTLLCCENQLYTVSRYGVKTTLTWRGTSENVVLPGRKWSEILPCKAAEKFHVFINDMQPKLLLFVLYELEKRLKCYWKCLHSAH